MKTTFKILLLVILPLLGFSQKKPAKLPAPSKRQLKGIQADLIRGPYLQAATPTSMVVRWRTNVYDRSRVRYGLSSDNLEWQTDDSTLVSEHIIKLSNLKPYTKYYYTVGNLADTTLQGDASNYFYTLPEKGSQQLIRVAGFGDCGNNSINQRLVRDAIVKVVAEKPINAWILMGDNAYGDGTDAEYQAKFFNNYKDNLLKNYPLFTSPGNHDYHDFASASASDKHKIAYYQNFTMPTQGEAGGVPSNTQSYYSYDIGNVHFLSLDSYGPDFKGLYMYDEGEQVEWVKKDLAANKSKWVVAYWHHPPYTMGSHNSDTEKSLVSIRQNFIKVLEEQGVDLIICGHSHVYERSKLLKGYYGMEADFDSKKYELSTSTGLYNGTKNSAPYLKKQENNQGTVYVVSGSSGALGGHKEGYPHNAMYYSNNEIGGAVMLEAEGNRLELKWICSDGEIRDQFTMMKDVSKSDEKILLKDKILAPAKTPGK
ncbi:3',5'-cyclic adenosine monophosphate phosphodiesterase CpdA [Dyadobacter sp. CECT 9275]|uniref:3',5'-cyclic adenosine monophosphate phosphodiesterase CpdA n=1 Tax=Dyadobacter helix TaxID=2822344 RepID=A0A916J9C2_9BACT|nr:metallophosphoesterase family protein [Dyadobacter sp. CECT 9275]CAG4995459.1 3',5'-cyclic adenosine monophosphate phosphodiesterase CpdA [Dyadobacter sp. CECT 9275]